MKTQLHQYVATVALLKCTQQFSETTGAEQIGD